MCLRHGRREGNIGSSKAGIKCTCGLKGKMKDWITKEMKEKSKTEKFKLDAISRSRGLVFIGQLEIYCPFRCNIRKYWDSMDFVLKISEREIFNTRAAPSSDRNIPSAPSSDHGILPASASNWKKSGNKMTKVDVQLNIPVNDLFAKLKDIYHTITSVVKCSFEFFVILRLPIIGEFEVYLGFVVKDLKISDVLEKSLSFVSEQENHPYVFRILSDLFNRHYVSQDVLETCLSKMIFHDKDTITYCVARMALDIYKHKSVDPHDLGKFLSKLFMKMSHEEETGGVVTSSKQRQEEMGSKQRQEEMGGCVARMALDIYNHKEKVSSGDLGKFLSILFKCPEEKTGDYVAQIVLDLYKGKAADSRPAMEGLIEIIFRESHPEVYRLLLVALDVYEGKLEEVKNDVLEFAAEMAPTFLAGFIRQYLASQRTGSKT